MPNIRKLARESHKEHIERVSRMMFNDGYHITEIANKLKCDKIEVYNSLYHTNKITDDEEREIIINLYNNGYSYREISDKLGISKACVARRIKSSAKYINTSHEYILTDRQLHNLKQWYLSGMSMAWIARKLNITSRAVKYRLIKSGIYKNNYTKSVPVTTKEEHRFNLLYKRGYTIGEISKECGRGYSIVNKVIHQSKNK